ncbi:MAG: class I tRNA ligase family protein, partial [Actinobacteria bacterium]|nr:class I tRNA ligase family protein [Actinomycetota bacterium]
DWYLEAAKVRLYGDDEDARATAQAVLAVVLDDLLRLLQPLMPFVTETLWRALTGAAGGRESLMAASWPTARTERDEDAEAAFALVQDLVTEVRKFRSQNDVAPSKRFELAVQTTQRDALEPHVPLVLALAGLESVSFVDQPVDEPGTSRIVFSAGECFVDLTGLIDVDAELARLDKEVAKAREDLQRVEGKLGNATFVDRAPEEVVQKERDRRDDLTRIIDELSGQAEQLRQLDA